MSLSRIAFVLAASLMTAPAAHAASGDTCIRAETPGPGRILAQSASGPIVLGRSARMVKLEPVCGAGERPLKLAERVTAAPLHRRFLLVIEDLRAEAQPGVLFDLKLSSSSARDGEDALLGTLNFYAAQKPGVAARPRMVSYDVTQTLRALATDHGLERGLTLAIQPVDDPAPGAKAAIGRIALVEQ